jgi:hypothetical protein
MLRPGGIELWVWPLFILMPLLLFGGIYWFPAGHVTRGRDPWFTGLLGLGLTVTVLLVGILSGPFTPRLGLAIAGAWCLLLLRRALGPLDHNLERFAPVHVLTLIGAIVLLDQRGG